MMKKIFISIFVSLLGIGVTFLFLELVVRVLPKRVTKIDYSLINDERIYTPTRIKFVPDLNRVWTSLGRPTVWSFNDLGFREGGIQLDKPANVYRIAVIGDSVIMGFGVEEYESIPRRLEDILRPQKFTNGMTYFQVLNLGVQGYSTPQYLAVLKKEALKMKPDLVIIGLYSNDPLEAASTKFNKKYTLLKSLPDFIPYKINRFLRKNSKLFLLILNRYYNLVEKSYVNIKPSPEMEKLGWDLVAKDITEMKKDMDRNNVKFVLLSIPILMK